MLSGVHVKELRQLHDHPSQNNIVICCKYDSFCFTKKSNNQSGCNVHLDRLLGVFQISHVHFK